MFVSENREQAVQWKDFFWNLRQYLAVVNLKFQSDVALILRDLDKAILMDDLDGEKQARSQFL